MPRNEPQLHVRPAGTLVTILTELTRLKKYFYVYTDVKSVTSTMTDAQMFGVASKVPSSLSTHVRSQPPPTPQEPYFDFWYHHNECLHDEPPPHSWHLIIFHLEFGSSTCYYSEGTETSATDKGHDTPSDSEVSALAYVNQSEALVSSVVLPYHTVTTTSTPSSHKINLWRRIFFSNFSTPVFKMWVIRKPNKVALWNKRHFEEKNGDYTACLKYSVRIFVE